MLVDVVLFCFVFLQLRVSGGLGAVGPSAPRLVEGVPGLGRASVMVVATAMGLAINL